MDQTENRSDATIVLEQKYAKEEVQEEVCRNEVKSEPVTLAQTDEQIGKIVAEKYRILEKIGEGGMGVVFKVEHVFLSQPMALKMLVADRYSESVLRRFQSEARLLARLDHPALVKVLDLGLLPNNEPYIVMDFVEGKTLSELLKNRGVFSIEQSIKIFIEVCLAIGYAHDQGVIHRDIKPSNIMLSNGDENSGLVHLKVLDFGIAKFIQNGQSESDALTRTGEIIGSPLYMSPEQCFGRPVDHRSDIYSIGCMMYEVLTGAPPFSGSTALNTMMLHESGQALSLKEASLGREFPQKLENIIRRMMEKEPDSRYQNLCDVARELLSIQGSITAPEHEHTAPVNTEKQRTFSPTRVKVITASIALVVICSISLLLWQTMSKQQSPEKRFTIHNMNPDTRWSELSPDGRLKIFNFPDDYSLGKITYSKSPQGNPITVEAQGIICFPANCKLGFTPSSKFLAYPKFLRAFRPDDLYCIDFSNAQSTQLDKLGEVADANILTDDEMIFLDHLSGLTYLYIKNTRVTDRGLAHISHLRNLRWLNVNGTDITGQGLSSSPLLPNLVWLDANNIQNGGAVTAGLKGSKNIENLLLANTGLVNDDLKNLATMPNLRKLNIVFNSGIDDEGMKYLLPLRNLNEVDLQNCQVTEKGLNILDKMNLAARPRLTENREWKCDSRTADFLKALENKN